MPNSDESATDRRNHRALVILTAGVGAIALSLIWPSLPLRKSVWTDDQARAYQEVSVKLHALSHRLGDELARTKTHSTPPELQQAQQEYDALRQQLDFARELPQRSSWIIFWIGAILSAVGAALYLAQNRN